MFSKEILTKAMACSVLSLLVLTGCQKGTSNSMPSSKVVSADTKKNKADNAALYLTYGLIVGVLDKARPDNNKALHCLATKGNDKIIQRVQEFFKRELTDTEYQTLNNFYSTPKNQQALHLVGRFLQDLKMDSKGEIVKPEGIDEAIGDLFGGRAEFPKEIEQIVRKVGKTYEQEFMPLLLTEKIQACK